MLLPERAVFESFWSETLKLYTEDSRTMIGGGGPVAKSAEDFKKGQPYLYMAGFFVKRDCKLPQPK